jgi:hypothetical protein
VARQNALSNKITKHPVRRRPAVASVVGHAVNPSEVGKGGAAAVVMFAMNVDDVAAPGRMPRSGSPSSSRVREVVIAAQCPKGLLDQQAAGRSGPGRGLICLGSAVATPLPERLPGARICGADLERVSSLADGWT